MSIDFSHPLVGREVVYTGWHPGAVAEYGTVTSVNVEANLVFVRYAHGSTSAATEADERLTFLSGKRVVLDTPTTPPEQE